MKLTKSVIDSLLESNDGYRICTRYCDGKSIEIRRYHIKDGELMINTISDTPGADGKCEKSWIANMDETERFIWKNILLV